MCGRYYIAQEDNDEEIARILAEMNRDLPKASEVHRGEIFPSQIAPVIVNTATGWSVKPMQWGFPQKTRPGIVINCRSEKADVTPMFSRAVRQGRCLIPMSGFFEWQHTAGGGKGQKHAFSLADGHAMFLAGIFESENGGFENGGRDVFAVLTMDADGQMRPYHHRMPVILGTRQARHGWLFSSPEAEYRMLKRLFLPPPLAVCPVKKQLL
ncbi:MAG: SOS response-associated peptidase [Clostridia bacterium]|nr:SOS response-associated peptidase [Clostridia bacterium]